MTDEPKRRGRPPKRKPLPFIAARMGERYVLDQDAWQARPWFDRTRRSPLILVNRKRPDGSADRRIMMWVTPDFPDPVDLGTVKVDRSRFSGAGRFQETTITYEELTLLVGGALHKPPQND